MKGKILGLLGTGAIGARVAEIAYIFGMKIIAHVPFPREDLAGRLEIEYLPVPEVLRRSDILSLHLPLTADTKGFFSFRNFPK